MTLKSHYLRYPIIYKMIGYKGFNSDLSCLGFQYSVGKTYSIDPNMMEMHKKGFHYCMRPIDVLWFYPSSGTRFAVIEPSGKIDNDITKSVCSTIKIVKEISSREFHDMALNNLSELSEDDIRALVRKLYGCGNSDMICKLYRAGIDLEWLDDAVDAINGFWAPCFKWNII